MSEIYEEYLEDEDIFQLLEIPVKSYIKRLIALAGFDTLKSLESFEHNNEKVEELEKYIQKRFGGSSLFNDSKELKKYFGASIVSAEEIKIFTFNLGARETLMIDIPEAVRLYKSKNQFGSCNNIQR